jgi:hypothetical protein
MHCYLVNSYSSFSTQDDFTSIISRMREEWSGWVLACYNLG